MYVKDTVLQEAISPKELHKVVKRILHIMTLNGAK